MDRLFKTENKPLKILTYLVLISVGISVGLAVLFCGGVLTFYILMSSSDQASYYANEVDVGPIDYNSVLTKAEKAGYEVSGPYTLDKAGLIEPGNIKSVEKRFKGDYGVSRVELYYDLNTYLDFEKDGNNQTLVTLFNYSYHDDAGAITPQMPSTFPEDSWMLKMLELSLRLNETNSRELLKKLKREELNQKEKQMGFVSLPTKESVDFPAVYAYLNRSSQILSLNLGCGMMKNFTGMGKRLDIRRLLSLQPPSFGYIIPINTVSMLAVQDLYVQILE
jgi:hypothetical protein